MSVPLRVAVVGCGLIGKRRAEQAELDSRSCLRWAVDTSLEIAQTVANPAGATASDSWHDVVQASDVDIVCIATPNMLLAPIAIAALDAGKHVLLEKPMGRNLAEARAIAQAAERAGRLVKIGFNHRYHPAIARAHEEFAGGRIGEIINMRARYGHGGRPGYEREWRGSREAAGGGELTDQGVHIADLMHWFAGLPAEAFAYLQTAVWPLGDLEDNAQGLFRFGSGAIASFHTSWTQWKNLFSLEIYGTRGSLCIEGLGKSYGVERLVIADRAMEGGIPTLTEIVFDEPDRSWELEWRDFMSAVTTGSAFLGTAADGIGAMTMVDALYRSAHDGRPYRIETSSLATT